MNYHIMTIRSALWGSLGRNNIENIQNHLTHICAKYFQEFIKKYRYNTVDFFKTRLRVRMMNVIYL